MPDIDLTPFGFTPTESLVYRVLLTGGPGTGYAIARTAGLARANAYSALEGLVTKGAARVEGPRPKRYRPEPPTALIARITNDHGLALDRLTAELEQVAVPDAPTLVELESVRAAYHLIGHEVGRAGRSVELVVPPDAFGSLAPALRRAVGAGVEVRLASTGAAALDFADVTRLGAVDGWPGTPVLAVVDDRSAVLAARRGAEIEGHWSTMPTLVAAARLAIARLRAEG